AADGAPAGFPAWTPPGENIALGKPYTFNSPADYDLTKDSGDAKQLTDGKPAPADKPMWFKKEAVGWGEGRVMAVAITIDLGTVEPIAGVSFNAPQGARSGVGLPPAILVLVSDDGKAFRIVGELVALSSKFG